MQTPMNYLLVNLAVADMMFTTFITPRFIFSHTFKHPEGTTGHYLCVFVTGGNLTWTGGDASVFSLVAIAFERYFAIMHPHNQWGRVTSKKLKTLIVASWVFAVFMTYPLYLSITYSKEHNFCVENWADIAYAKAYSLSCFLLLGTVPLCIMGVLYLRVVMALWCSGQRENGLPRQALMRSRKRVTRMVILVSVLYGVTWMPNLTSYLLNYYHPSYMYGDSYYLTSILLVTVNSTVNPFIYGFTNERFRRCVCSLFCRGRSATVIQPVDYRREDPRREICPIARIETPFSPAATSQGQGKREMSSTGNQIDSLSPGLADTELSSQHQGHTELSSSGQGNTEL